MKMMLRLALFPLLFSLAGCAGGGVNLDIPGFGKQESDETAIAKVLNAVQLGMETKKVNKIMAHVSPNYLDEEGRNADGMRDYLDYIMNNYRSIKIDRSPPTIVVQGDRARVVEAFGTRGEPDNAKSPPISLQGQVSVYLERTPDGWKIVEWGSIS